MQLPFKWFAIILMLLVLLLVVPLFGIRYSKPDYVCAGSLGIQTGEQRLMLKIQGFELYSRPFIIDCPLADRRDRGQVKALKSN